jgi:hypothetical protein
MENYLKTPNNGVNRHIHELLNSTTKMDSSTSTETTNRNQFQVTQHVIEPVLIDAAEFPSRPVSSSNASLFPTLNASIDRQRIPEQIDGDHDLIRITENHDFKGDVNNRDTLAINSSSNADTEEGSGNEVPKIILLF